MFTQSLKLSPGYPSIQAKKTGFSGSNNFARLNKLEKDQFISFKGVDDQHQKCEISDLPEIIVLDGIHGTRTKEEYVNGITEHLLTCPKNIANDLKDKGFKIIISPTLSKGLLSQGVYDNEEGIKERVNEYHMATAFIDTDLSKYLIIIAAKALLGWEFFYPQKINSAIGHALVKAHNLTKDDEIKKAYVKDLKEALSQHKYDKLSGNERSMINDYLLKTSEKNTAEKLMEETIADVIAWQLYFGGIYGGDITSVYNPDLMPTLYPNLTEVIKKRFFQPKESEK